MENMSQVILGTVQLGMPYGLGRLSQDVMPQIEAFKILHMAFEGGIRTLDTSPDYGLAQARIGDFLNQNSASAVNIITKVKQIPVGVSEVKAYLRQYLNQCPFSKMDNCSSLSLLLHNEMDLYREEVRDGLNEIVHRGYIQNWGVSVYGVDVAASAAGYEGCSLIQLPYGIFDRQFEQKKTIRSLKDKQKHVIARSIFTKGLVFQSLKYVRSDNKRISALFLDLEECAKDSNMSIAEYAFNFVIENRDVDSIAIGVDAVEQMQSLLDQKYKFTPKQLNSASLKTISEFRDSFFSPNKWA